MRGGAERPAREPGAQLRVDDQPMQDSRQRRRIAMPIEQRVLARPQRFAFRALVRPTVGGDGRKAEAEGLQQTGAGTLVSGTS